MSTVDPMADIMSADDAIDALPEIGVKDCYVRAKLMRALMDHHSGSPTGWESDAFKRGETALTHYNHDGVRAWAASDRALSGWIRDAARDNRAEDFTLAVWDGITNDEMSESRKVEIVRGWLKRHLSGSLGMPDDRVIRERLKDYDGSDA